MSRDHRRFQLGKHHSIARYFYIRQSLPDELVEDFENTFEIAIPEEYASFDDFDTFLSTDADAMISILESGNSDISDMQEWLRGRMTDLDRAINDQKSVAHLVDVESVVCDAGVCAPGSDMGNLCASFVDLMQPDKRMYYEGRIGISLEDISLRARLHLLQYMHHKSNTEMDAVIPLTNGGGHEKVGSRPTSFLSRAWWAIHG